MNNKPLIIILIVVLVGVGAYYFLSNQPGGRTPPAAPPAATPGATAVSSNAVSIQDFSFSPKVIRVKQGTKVVWKNSDIVSHTVTSDSNAFSSPLLGQAKTFEYTFAAKGEYSYHCTPHPRMKGTVIVE